MPKCAGFTTSDSVKTKCQSSCTTRPGLNHQYCWHHQDQAKPINTTSGNTLDSVIVNENDTEQGHSSDEKSPGDHCFIDQINTTSDNDLTEKVAVLQAENTFLKNTIGEKVDALQAENTFLKNTIGDITSQIEALKRTVKDLATEQNNKINADECREVIIDNVKFINDIINDNLDMRLSAMNLEIGIDIKRITKATDATDERLNTILNDQKKFNDYIKESTEMKFTTILNSQSTFYDELLQRKRLIAPLYAKMDKEVQELLQQNTEEVKQFTMDSCAKLAEEVNERLQYIDEFSNGVMDTLRAIRN